MQSMSLPCEQMAMASFYVITLNSHKQDEGPPVLPTFQQNGETPPPMPFGLAVNQIESAAE